MCSVLKSLAQHISPNSSFQQEICPADHNNKISSFSLSRQFLQHSAFQSQFSYRYNVTQPHNQGSKIKWWSHEKAKNSKNWFLFNYITPYPILKNISFLSYTPQIGFSSLFSSFNLLFSSQTSIINKIKNPFWHKQKVIFYIFPCNN